MPFQDPPIPENEQRRLAALVSCEVMDTPRESGYDDLTRFAAEIFGAPIALVSLVDEHRQWFKSCVGLDVAETPRNIAFCAHAIMTDEPLVVPDALEDPRFDEHPLVVGEPFIRFYAGVPLRLTTGERLGTLCVIDRAPREPTNTQMQRLSSLAGQVSALLELRRRVRMLRESEERQQRLIEALSEAKVQAEEASRLKSEFLANTSHEIRTPLTAILGYAELLVNDETVVGSERERSRAAWTILRNGKHLLQIINDILDLSKIESGHFHIERVDFDPAPLIDEVAASFRVKAEQKGLRLSVEWASPAPASVGADPDRFRQVLTNIIGNAVKFTSAGSVVIRVMAEGGEETPERLTVEVEDTGIGMNAEQIERIFKPFVQADASTTRRFGGTGLGLHISRRLANLLGGDLSVRSEEGSGSVFTITIDATPCGRSIETKRPAQPAPTNTNAGALCGQRVLVAEDGPDNQRLIQHLLSKAGASVTLVDNGREAVEAYRAKPDRFSLILMDMQMPEMDGYEAARALRKLGCTLPIVALTANAMEGDRAECIEAGCTDYATKPIDPATLIELCRSLVDAPAVQAA
ncbi:MAG: response regulator [Phycisphaerales bacterium]|nr:response regulator [Phycisphaerales bacterium]